MSSVNSCAAIRISRKPHNNLGWCCLQAGDVPMAQGEFIEAVRLKPRYAEAHYNLALALHQEGKEEEISRRVREGYDIAPELRERAPPLMKDIPLKPCSHILLRR